MSAPPSDSDPLPDDDDLGDPADEDHDDLDGLGDSDPSGDAVSDPESARQEAEDALAEIEALADLDEEPDLGDESASGKGAAAGGGAPVDAHAAPEDTAGPASDEGTPEDQCENCGALLHGPYCSQCGQKSADRIVPIWHMINEALEAVFEFDLRVFRTFPKFLFLPGRLTKEYIEGRRKRYIRPFRLYLFATFLLFTTLALTTSRGGFDLLFPPATATAPADTTQTVPADTVEAAAAERPSPPDTTGFVGVPLAERADSARSGASSGGGSLFGPEEEREKMARRIEEDTSVIQIEGVFDDPAANARLERTLQQNLPEIIRNPWDFVESLIDRGPYLMFVMLPIFAFLLKLLYVRWGRLYAEHMIFSLHVHAFAFFAFTVGLLLNQSDLGWLNTAGPWVELSPLLYLVLALGHVYDQGLIKSTIKAFILLTIYSIVLAIGFALLLFFAILFA
jgi:hypothetical protein